MRTLLGYAILAIVGFVALKLVFGLIGFAISLVMTLLWLAAIGFVFYLVLKLVSPKSAARVHDAIKGNKPRAAA
ncbi:MAG TPA: hypothetical protein VGA37_06535 [Gemmatimonadales bacterium]